MMFHAGICVGSINYTLKALQRATGGVRKSPNELSVLLFACDHAEAVGSGSSLVGQPRFGTGKSTSSSPVW